MKRRDFLVQGLATAGSALLLGHRQARAAPEPARGGPAGVTTPGGLDWRQFLAAQDPLWERLPGNWWEAPFLGNGLMGTMLRQDGPQSVRWDVDRSDVQEHRPLTEGGALWARTRLPIGYFALGTVGTITGGRIRLDLWNAETTGEIVTSRGSVRFRTLVHAEAMILFTEIQRMGGEGGARLEWHGLEALCPRAAFHPVPHGYEKNPPFTLGQSGESQTCTQPLKYGGRTTTAWHQADQDARTTLYASVAHTYPSADSDRLAVESINRARGESLDSFIASHRAWWHDFYPASFLSLPDPYWQSFYWIQMYKLASATRADRALVDNQGPWLQPTPWPAAWWNLNVQLTYWATGPSNHLDLAESLSRHIDDNVQTLIGNVPEPYRSDSAGIGRASGQDLRVPVGMPGKGDEVGDLTWALHDYWEQNRRAMDDGRLRAHLYPLLTRAVNYYLHFLTADDQGVLHLPSTYSPEFGAGPDCTYDLALLRWGLQTLIQSARRLAVADPQLPRWKETLEKLTPYATNQDGYMIARGVPLDHGHRHFSHLLQAFPLHLVHPGQPGAWEVVNKTVTHWQGMGEKEGYSFTGASLIASAFGKGDQSLEYLNGLKHFLQPNTLYHEAGPVIETPLSAARALQEMMLQSWAGPEEEAGALRVFPAVPDVWADAAMENMRAEGGFLVSAVREKGKTRFVRLESLAGEPCRVSPRLDAPVRVAGARPMTLHDEGDGTFSLDLRKGEAAILYSGDAVPSLAIAPVTPSEATTNVWGLKAHA